MLGSARRFFWIKNQQGLVQAFASVAKDIPEAVLLLVGTGDPQPARHLADLGVDAQVRTVPFREDMPELGPLWTSCLPGARGIVRARDRRSNGDGEAGPEHAGRHRTGPAG